MADDSNLKLGNILIQKGWITWDQLEEALRIQKEADSSQKPLKDILSMEVLKKTQTLFLGEVLVKQGALRWDQLQKALNLQRETGRLLGDILLTRNFVTQRDLYRALATQNNAIFIDFDKIKIDRAVLNYIPKTTAQDLNVMPLVAQDKALLVAISDPQNLQTEMELKKVVSGIALHYAMAAPDDIRVAIERYYH